MSKKQYIYNKADKDLQSFDIAAFRLRHQDYADAVSEDAENVYIEADNCPLGPDDLRTPAQQEDEDEKRNIDKMQNRILAIVAKSTPRQNMTQEERDLVRRFCKRWGKDIQP